MFKVEICQFSNLNPSTLSGTRQSEVEGRQTQAQGCQSLLQVFISSRVKGRVVRLKERAVNHIQRPPVILRKSFSFFIFHQFRPILLNFLENSLLCSPLCMSQRHGTINTLSPPVQKHLTPIFYFEQ